MLTKTSQKIAAYKKMRTFHTTQSMRSLIFDSLIHESASDASAQARANQELLQENNALLKKIAAQNEENNKLLRAVLQQNYLLSYRTYNNYAQRDEEIYKKLNHFHNMLEKEHNIKIRD
jgi:hypothetical protein